MTNKAKMLTAIIVVVAVLAGGVGLYMKGGGDLMGRLSLRRSSTPPAYDQTITSVSYFKSRNGSTGTNEKVLSFTLEAESAKIAFKNNKLFVDLTLNELWDSTEAFGILKLNGIVIAVGGADLLNDETTGTGQIVFTLGNTYKEIEINGTEQFSVEMDTAKALTDDATFTEELTATVDFGDITVNSNVAISGTDPANKVVVTTKY